MKRFGTMLFALCLAALPSFGSHAQPSPYSQFRLKRAHASHRNKTNPAAKTRSANQRPVGEPMPPFASAPSPSSLTRKAAPGRKPVRQGRFNNKVFTSSIPTVSFVAGVRSSTTEDADDNTQPVMGDFDGNGKKDVAKIVSDYALSPTYSIATLLGNGDGTFQTAILTDTAFDTDDPIVVGDLNGDGKDDIVQIHPTGDNCSRSKPAGAPPQLPCGTSIDVFISNGDGTFAAPVNYTITGPSLIGGLLTDVDSDGHLDVLVVDNLNEVLVLTGAGDGTFSASSTLTTLSGALPENLFFADFDGDGKLDIAGDDGSEILVYLATGATTWAAPVALVTQDGNYSSCFNTAGDLTADGKPEIVSLSCEGGEDNHVVVYVNNGDGTFQPGVYYNNTGDLYTDPVGAVIADVNGDGNGDIVITNEQGGAVSIMFSDGTGRVRAGDVTYGVSGDPWMIPLVADFNGDGLLDVVESDDYSNVVFLQGYGDGTFRGAPNIPLAHSSDQYGYSYSVATGDFNGDGIPDLAVGQASNYGSTGVMVYLGKGDGTFYPGVGYGGSSHLEYVAVADFNGDGKLDIAATDSSDNVIQILLGNGDGTFNVGLNFDVGGSNPNNLVVGDFNKDGFMDLATANESSANVAVFLGNGDGSFAPAVTYNLTGGYDGFQVATADIDGDGYLDLAVTAFSGGGGAVGVLLNDETGAFLPATFTTVDGGPEFVAFADLDKDGKADMVVTERFGSVLSGFVEIGLGNGDGTFGALTAYSTSTLLNDSPRPADIQILDLNGDGNLDLLVVNSNFGTISVMYGNGDGTVNTPVEFPGNYDNYGLAVADLDGDGAADVIIGNDYSGGPTVFLNGNGSGTLGNYTLGTTTPSQSVAAGASANYTLNLAGINGYTGTITFACSNLPTGATCSFNPSSVIANGGVPFTTTMTIATTASASASFVPASRPGQPGGPILLAGFAGIGMLGLVLAGTGPKARQRRASVVLGMLLLLTLGTVVGCDNENPIAKTSTGTPAGAYAVTVTSTGTGTNAPTHSLNVTLVVQ